MKPAIVIASYLAPNLFHTYEYIAHYIGEKLARPVIFKAGGVFGELVHGLADVGFICGLAYIRLNEQQPAPLKLLVAPVLQGPRYRRKPIYFSDVIVRRESFYTSFSDLDGQVLAYNEKESHSGYNLVHYSLLQQGLTPRYFGELLRTGSHHLSIQAVLEGRAGAAAIDSHMLDVAFLQDPSLANRLRVVEMLGPSTIPPVVTSPHLSRELSREIQQILLEMSQDPLAAKHLRRGLIEQFVPIHDRDYDDLRVMTAAVQEAEHGVLLS